MLNTDVNWTVDTSYLSNVKFVYKNHKFSVKSRVSIQLNIESENVQHKPVYLAIKLKEAIKEFIEMGWAKCCWKFPDKYHIGNQVDDVVIYFDRKLSSDNISSLMSLFITQGIPIAEDDIKIDLYGMTQEPKTHAVFYAAEPNISTVDLIEWRQISTRLIRYERSFVGFNTLGLSHGSALCHCIAAPVCMFKSNEEIIDNKKRVKEIVNKLMKFTRSTNGGKCCINDITGEVTNVFVTHEYRLEDRLREEEHKKKRMRRSVYK